MRRASPLLALLTFAGSVAGWTACSPGGPPAADAGTPSPTDAGGCGASCLPPDAGECLAQGASCPGAGVEGSSCCPGFVCDGGLCAPPPNPCANGRQLLPTGCGCDPSLGAESGCDAGLICNSDLQCVVDAGTVLLVAQPVGAPCEPLASYPDGGAAPPCAEPEAADGGGLDAGAAVGTVDCVPDPSGVYLYVCAQACATNQDCPLPWQTCNSAFAASGHCGDEPCTAFPATPTQEAKSYFATCADGGGLCLPFTALVSATNDAGVQLDDYGLCLQASDAGPNSACADPPSRDGPLCDAEQLCLLGRCRTPCNAAVGVSPDAGDCLASEVCTALGVQPVVPGALYAAGGCVNPCELDGGACDAGIDAGIDAGADAGIDAGEDAGVDAGMDAGMETGLDAGEAPDGGDTNDGGDGG